METGETRKLHEYTFFPFFPQVHRSKGHQRRTFTDRHRSSPVLPSTSALPHTLPHMDHNRARLSVASASASRSPVSHRVCACEWGAIAFRRATLTLHMSSDGVCVAMSRRPYTRDCPLALDDLKFKSINRIPPARGLGSSSAALVSGLAAGLALAGQDIAAPQTKQLLLQLAADAEVRKCLHACWLSGAYLVCAHRCATSLVYLLVRKQK